MTTVYLLTSAMGDYDHLIGHELIAVYGLPPDCDEFHIELENQDVMTVAARLALRDERLDSSRSFDSLYDEYEAWLNAMIERGAVALDRDDEIVQDDDALQRMLASQRAAQEKATREDAV